MFALLRVFVKDDLAFRRNICVKQISMAMGTYVNTRADSSSKHSLAELWQVHSSSDLYTKYCQMCKVNKQGAKKR